MTTISVQMVWMGSEYPGLNLNDVVRVANKAQQTFQFTVGYKIETVGVQDKDGQYSFGHLARLLKKTRRVDDVEIIVGVIDAMIYDELFSTTDEDDTCVIISVNDVDGILAKVNWHIEPGCIVEVDGKPHVPRAASEIVQFTLAKIPALSFWTREDLLETLDPPAPVLPA